MRPELHILMLEDRATDADLAERELRRAGLEFRAERVQTREAFERALVEFSPDLILADSSVPGFDGLTALATARERRPDTPFILVTAELGEERAVEAVKSGATDFVLKQRLERLVPVVQRAMREAAERSARKRAEEALRQSQAGLEAAQAQARLGSWELDPVTRTGTWSKEMFRLFGRDPALGSPTFAAFLELIQPEDRQGIVAGEAGARTGGEAGTSEFRSHPQRGPVKHFLATAHAVKDAAGQVVWLTGTVQDVTERKRAEAALREAEVRFRTLFDRAPVGVVVIDPDTARVIEANEIAARQLGYSLEEFVKLEIADFEAMETSEQTRAHFEKVLREGQDSFETRHVTKTGDVREVWVSTQIIELSGRAVAHSIFLDITERKRAEAKYRSIFEQSVEGIFQTTPEGKFLAVNPAMARIFGYDSPEEMIRERQDIGRDGYAEPGRREEFKWLLETQNVIQSFEYEARRKDGSMVWVSENARVVRDDRGLVAYYEGALEDITAQKRAEQALQRREKRFRSLIENAHDLITVLGGDGVIHFQSPSSRTALGYAPEQVENRSAYELIHPEDAPRVQAAVEVALANPDRPSTVEFRFRHADGSWRILESIGKRLVEEPGPVVVINSRDLTERRKLEEQFRQAQKMEAIGQLAGGVAHDFNNILTVIQGHASLLLTEEQLSDVATESVMQIARGAERAASLTRQLLAFSRKQVMQPKDLDLNELVSHLAKMLHRVLGEDIQLHLELSSSLPLIHADATMLDQILLNLAVNARDAMPRGGRLIIRTEAASIDQEYSRLNPEAKAGSYVRLSVIDTGCGIAPEYMPRIFEPFFTTKEAGKGTGLGLATVFGAVKQHEGWINVYSELGQGTTFHVYLPAHDRPRQPGDTALLEKPLRGGTETILVVEDQSEVRELVRCVLEQYGYTVLEAGDGVEALSVWQEHRNSIDLVLTDMVMPGGLSGFDLAAKLLIEKPAVKIIFTSGYSADIFGKELALEDGLNFLQKPYRPRQLVQAVRHCLDELGRS